MSKNSIETAPASQEKFLSENELLTRLPICRRTAFNWIQQGKLPCIKIGRRKLFHFPSVEAALLRLQRGGSL
jgi:predicted DNA-binding transcriptional regulator AlpA